MKTRRHIYEESLPASAQQLFALLHTPSAIREWWSAARAIVMPEVGGTWAAAWGQSEDDPDYMTSATIRVFDPPHRMVLCDYRYFAKSGPLPFEADLVLEFSVIQNGAEVSLRVDQDGFPAGAEADEFFAGCRAGWESTFVGIRE